MNDFKRIQDYLDDIVADLRKAAPKQTGKLEESITADLIRTDDGDFTVEIGMAEYGIFQDEGVNGIGRSFGSRFSFTNKMPSPKLFDHVGDEGVQFAIARSIFENGIRPKHFISPVLDKAIDKLADFAAEDIADFIFAQLKEEDK